MTATRFLSAEGVTVRYGARTAVRSVDLGADRGELVALTGPNGSGKSTLLRAALGLVPVAEGRITMGGRPVGSLSIRERARTVTWMPQNESVLENIPVGQYVLYGRHCRIPPLSPETEADRAKVRDALETVGLELDPRRGLLELSGGERQRALLARVLAQESPLLLLDEPIAHLDIGHQLDLLERVRHLAHAGGKGVVVALHDLNLAARFADRVAVLDRGRLVADGPPSSVLSTDLLREVWGIVAELRLDPRSGLPYLVPSLPNAPAEAPAHRPNVPSVHVIGGGGAASELMRRLVDRGLRVTLGVVAIFDTDEATAEELGVRAVVDVPFSPLSDPLRAQNREWMGSAAAIVVAPFAVGPANLGNLEDALPFVRTKPVLLYEPIPIETRDFVGGRAVALRHELCAHGALGVTDLDGVIEQVESALGLRPAIGPRGDGRGRQGESIDGDRRGVRSPEGTEESG